MRIPELIKAIVTEDAKQIPHAQSTVPTYVLKAYAPSEDKEYKLVCNIRSARKLRKGDLIQMQIVKVRNTDMYNLYQYLPLTSQRG